MSYRVIIKKIIGKDIERSGRGTIPEFVWGTEENHENFSQTIRYLSRDLNPGPTENEET